MNDLTVIPYFKTKNGWSIPEADMCFLFQMFKKDNLINTMFPFGGINDEIDFITWFRNPGNTMQVIRDDEGPLMLFWINNKNGKSFYFHFACLKRGWGKRTSELFQKAVSSIFSLKYNGKRIFDVGIGTMDSRNRMAINFVKKIGITILGDIPYYFRDVTTGDFLPATMAYITYEEVQKWEI